MVLAVGSAPVADVRYGGASVAAVHLGAEKVWPVGGWSPTDLALYAWFDPSDPATLQHTNGQVSRMDDLSGNGRHVTQSNDQFKPTTGTRTIGGLNALLCEQASAQNVALSKNLWVATTGVAQPITVAQVYVRDQTRGDGDIPFALNTAAGYCGGMFVNQWWIKGDQQVRGGAVPANGTTICAVTVLDGSRSRLRVNGGEVLAGDTATLTPRFLAVNAIGIDTYANDYGIVGAIGETVVAVGALAAPQITALESYLMAKWGIT